MSIIDEMNKRFGQLDGVKFCSSEEIYPSFKESLPLLIVENKQAKLVMALNGAHVISFVASGKPDMLWLSPQSRMAEGAPVRGGIPLCLPWFGPHPAGYPQHGFARITNWQVKDVTQTDAGATKIVLGLSDTAANREMWPHAFEFCFEVIVGTQLRLSLSVRNLGKESARLEFAFHTYFNVGNVEETIVEGLEDCLYIDREDGQTRKRQDGKVEIKDVIQNLYVDVPIYQLIESPAGKYKIEGSSRCSLVWNAGHNDKNIADMGAGNHRGYLCVERLDAVDWARNLASGESYNTTMILSNAQ